MEFFAAPLQTPGLLEWLAAHAPQNPFCTPGYFRAMQRLGAEPWIAGLKQGERRLSAAGVFLRRGRLNTTAGIASLPAAASTEEYWAGLLRFSSAHGVTQIEADSYASPSLTIPALRGETHRRIRHEYVLDLVAADLDQSMAKNHRQSLRKARESGLKLRRSGDEKACREHLGIVRLSLERRRRRGETIDSEPVLLSYLPYLECGCGELFQAMQGESTLASALVWRLLPLHRHDA
jgi:hypothetical protein